MANNERSSNADRQTKTPRPLLAIEVFGFWEFLSLDFVKMRATNHRRNLSLRDDSPGSVATNWFLGLLAILFSFVSSSLFCRSNKLLSIGQFSIAELWSVWPSQTVELHLRKLLQALAVGDIPRSCLSDVRIDSSRSDEVQQFLQDRIGADTFDRMNSIFHPDAWFWFSVLKTD